MGRRTDKPTPAQRATLVAIAQECAAHPDHAWAPVGSRAIAQGTVETLESYGWVERRDAARESPGWREVRLTTLGRDVMMRWCVGDGVPTPRIDRRVLARMAAANSKRMPQVVNDGGARYRWSGNSWLPDGPLRGDETVVEDV